MTPSGLSDERREMWGRLVASRRKMLGLSQRELASNAHTTQATIWKIENGRVTPSDDMKLRIAAALRARVVDLFPLENGL